jgi:hypothetical protein
MSLIPFAPFRFLISDKRKAFVIPAVNDRDRKIIRRAAAATDDRPGQRGDQVG